MRDLRGRRRSIEAFQSTSRMGWLASQSSWNERGSESSRSTRSWSRRPCRRHTISASASSRDPRKPSICSRTGSSPTWSRERPAAPRRAAGRTLTSRRAAHLDSRCPCTTKSRRLQFCPTLGSERPTNCNGSARDPSGSRSRVGYGRRGQATARPWPSSAAAVTRWARVDAHSPGARCARVVFR